MRFILVLTAGLAALTGCATVENETTETIVLNGRETELRTRTFSENGQPRESYSVRSRNGSFQPCDPNTPGSCARAARSNAGGKSR